MSRFWFSDVDLKGFSTEQVEALWMNLNNESRKELFLGSIKDPIRRRSWQQVIMFNLHGLRGETSSFGLIKSDMQELVDALIAQHKNHHGHTHQ